MSGDTLATTFFTHCEGGDALAAAAFFTHSQSGGTPTALFAHGEGGGLCLRLRYVQKTECANRNHAGKKAEQSASRGGGIGRLNRAVRRHLLRLQHASKRMLHR